MADVHPLEHYNYPIEEHQVGRMPAEPRHNAQLMIYEVKANKVYFDTFIHLSNYLPEKSLLVLNQTGVIPARIVFTKDTGGKVEGLILFNEGIQPDGSIPAIVNKKIIVGRKLYIEQYEFDIVGHKEQYFYIKPLFDISQLEHILTEYGTTPTPKYLGKLNMDEAAVRERYQTIFAKEKKSVAAPTASLHFTQQVFEKLHDKEIDNTDVYLDVGMGTFAEVSQANIRSKSLHTEPIFIPRNSIEKLQKAMEKHQLIIAVGTTAIRTLESQAELLLDPKINDDIRSKTNLFIMPNYEFKIADGLLTNFHVPKSSLMALVDAFLQHKKAKRNILELYQMALDKDFKFFSFGDSMLII